MKMTRTASSRRMTALTTEHGASRRSPRLKQLTYRDRKMAAEPTPPARMRAPTTPARTIPRSWSCRWMVLEWRLVARSFLEAGAGVKSAGTKRSHRRAEGFRVRDNTNSRRNKSIASASQEEAGGEGAARLCHR